VVAGDNGGRMVPEKLFVTWWENPSEQVSVVSVSETEVWASTQTLTGDRVPTGQEVFVVAGSEGSGLVTAPDAATISAPSSNNEPTQQWTCSQLTT